MEKDTSQKNVNGNINEWDTLKDVNFKGDESLQVKKIKGEYYKSEYVVEEENGGYTEYHDWAKMTPEEVEKYQAQKAEEKRIKLENIKSKINNIFHGKEQN